MIPLALGALALGATATHAADTGLGEHGAAQRNSGDKTAMLKAEAKEAKAKNVILLIGDGMGDSEITVARNYAKGAAGQFEGIDALPVTGSYTTYSLQKGTEKPDYVPDSAATGSAWATGTKTYDNAISVDTFGEPQETLLEWAKERGLKTGDVTTSELQDATPAVQVSHISARKCYGPVATAANCPDETLEAGGPGSITEQLIETRPDVTLGGGSKTFQETATGGDYAGKTLQEQAEERGYNIVENKDDLAAVSTADQDAPLLGLFAEGNLPVRYTGPIAQKGGTGEPVECTENADRPDTQPSLADMTSKAIDLLDNDNGFFLQVEGASIDKEDHAANACGQIGETVDLDEATQAALEFAKKDGNTLVIVTADHAHTSQIVEANQQTPGLTTNLITADGQPMTVNYATSETPGSQSHTGSQVRIAAYGPGAANVSGLTDQTDTYFTIRSAFEGYQPPVAAAKILGANIKNGSKLAGKATVRIKLDTADAKTVIKLVRNGKTLASNAKDGKQTGKNPTLKVNTKKIKNGKANVTIKATVGGKSTTKTYQVKIRNKR
ncbi:alkaline phosphatase [Nocardioides sp. Soil797]|nr:alkaline phosphatase [Nocardioides sp. Soil797]